MIYGPESAESRSKFLDAAQKRRNHTCPRLLPTGCPTTVSMRQTDWLSGCLPVCLSVYLSIYLSLCLSGCLWQTSSRRGVRLGSALHVIVASEPALWLTCIYERILQSRQTEIDTEPDRQTDRDRRTDRQTACFPSCCWVLCFEIV